MSNDKKSDAGPPDRLPVTAEVGDEGGSYADAAVQAETFSGVFGNPRVDPQSVGAEAGPRDPTDTDTEHVVPATEPPEDER